METCKELCQAEHSVFSLLTSKRQRAYALFNNTANTVVYKYISYTAHK